MRALRQKPTLQQMLFCLILLGILLASCGVQGSGTTTTSETPMLGDDYPTTPQAVELAVQSGSSSEIEEIEAQLGSLEEELTTLRQDHNLLNSEFRSLKAMFDDLSAHVLDVPDDSALDAWAWICEFMVDAYGRYPGPRAPGAIFNTRDSRLSTDDECVRLGYLPDLNQ